MRPRLTLVSRTDSAHDASVSICASSTRRIGLRESAGATGGAVDEVAGVQRGDGEQDREQAAAVAEHRQRGELRAAGEREGRQQHRPGDAETDAGGDHAEGGAVHEVGRQERKRQPGTVANSFVRYRLHTV